MSDLKLKAWHIQNLIDAEEDAQVVLLCDAQQEIQRLKSVVERLEKRGDDYLHAMERSQEIERAAVNAGIEQQQRAEAAEQRADELERELDSHKDLIYVIDGWYQDFQNNDYGSANEWLRHIRDAYNKIFNEEFDGVSVLHERDIVQQAKGVMDYISTLDRNLPEKVYLTTIAKDALIYCQQLKSQGE